MSDDEDEEDPNAEYVEALGASRRNSDSVHSQDSHIAQFSNSAPSVFSSSLVSVSRLNQQKRKPKGEKEICAEVPIVLQAAEQDIAPIAPIDPNVDLDELRKELRKKSKGCKDTCCARNVFREMPIIGGLFDLHSKTSKCEKLSSMVKEACGLAAGGAAMVLTPAEPGESEQNRIAKLALAMTAGTVAGRVAYNIAGSIFNRTFNCHLKEKDGQQVLDEAYLQALGGSTKRRNSESENSQDSYLSHSTHHSETSYTAVPVPLSLSVSRHMQQLQPTEGDDVSESLGSSTLLSVSLVKSYPQSEPVGAGDYHYEDDLDALADEFRKKGCKDTWCARNVFREIPIIGGLFDFHSKTSKCEKLSSMVKEACGLAAGGAAMVITPVEPEDSEQDRIAKLALAMTAGTVAGRIAYNVAGSVCNGMTMLYSCCLKRAAERQRRQQVSSDGGGLKVSLQSPVA